MEFKDLTPEQQAKLEGSKNPEEVLALAKEAGIELSEEQLERIAGGWGEEKCPKCGSTEFGSDHTGTADMVYVCKKCGNRW